MGSTDLCYRWTFDPSPSARECIRSAIQCDNEHYSVVPCHPGPMTVVVQRIGDSGKLYLYELRCTCETVIRTDGGMLAAGAN
jgi:hypothetical protein